MDLKGYIPRYVLDAVSKIRGIINDDVVLLMNVFMFISLQALTSSMVDYMTYLRKHINELRQRRRR